MMQAGMREVVLASGSQTRRELLHAAGIAFNVVPADIDEAGLRDRLAATGATPGNIAAALAKAKAEEIAQDRRDALIIGADQILALGSEIFVKPADLAAARASLVQLRGRTHVLHSAIVILEPGAAPWSHTSTASLTMRDFTDAVLDEYLARVGASACDSVGAYKVEGPAIQLFDRVDGDHFTILGLPLLPLLAELRRRGALAS